ncbi:MAG: hypothetical protein FJ096_09065 [Deltaproteobacteria bacterium]|nr:hypothetical protein [Deltaproteobacteria bacterium]
MKLPDPGLYRTHKPYPGHEETIPKGVLVYIGVPSNGSLPFVVRPGSNRNNRWYWGEPTIPLRSTSWAEGLLKLPSEGFYTLPRDLVFDGGGRWLQNAIVQLGYNGEGRGIIFVGEQHEEEERNILVFSDRGRVCEDELLFKLRWAPILPVTKE